MVQVKNGNVDVEREIKIEIEIESAKEQVRAVRGRLVF